MNRLFSLLVVLSIFSLAEDVDSLEGTLSSPTNRGINFSTKVLNSWFGTDMKVVVSDVNNSTLSSAFISNIIVKNDKLESLNSSQVSIDVPKTKLTVEVDSSCIQEHGKNIYNAEAGVRYTLESGLGLETGYKVIRLNSDEVADLKLNSDSLGLYGRLVMAF